MLILITKTSFSQGEYNRFALGLNTGMSNGFCDGKSQGIGSTIGATMKYSINNRFAIRTGLNYSKFNNKNAFFSSTSTPLAFEINGIFNAINFRNKTAEKNGYRSVFSSLYIGIGSGLFYSSNSYSNKYSGQVNNIGSTYLCASVGYKIKLNSFLDLNIEYNFKKTKTDLLDGFEPLSTNNKSNDLYGVGIVEILFNLGNGKGNIEWTDMFEGLIKNIKTGNEKATFSKDDYDVIKKRVDDLDEKIKDSDFDGIPDMLDKEINSPTIIVDRMGITLDTDGDNVPDYLDKCPLNSGSNTDGCVTNNIPKQKYVSGSKLDLGIEGIQFEPGKAIIKPISYNVLNKVIKIMTDNAALELSIEGHTDNIGNEAANLSLSKARASAVKKYLIENYIEDYRITTQGFGSKKPITTNKTLKGKMLNRRVEFILQ